MNRQRGGIRAIQEKIPWIMAPLGWIDFILTPERWACAISRVTTWFTRVVVIDSTRPARVLSRLLRVFSLIRAGLLARSAILRRVAWQIRKFIWSMIWAISILFRRWPRKVSIPKEEKPIRLISAPESYADFRAPALIVPASVPCAEKSLGDQIFVQWLHLFQDLYPIVASHQPLASHDPQTRLRQTYSLLYRLVRPPPRWHPDLVQAAKANDLLGALAVGGPFAKLLERAASDSDRYVIDLAYLSDYPVREGLCRLGCKIHYLTRDGKLSVASIDYDNEFISPGDSKWELVEHIALAALLTHLTVWRQGMEYHVGGLAPVAAITHNMPPAHPIRRLLAAHTAQTLTTNYFTHLTLRRSGFDVQGFSFPYDVILRYYDDGARAFDISRLDVQADAARRGIPDTLDYPYLPQALQYYALFESYVRSYVDHVYADESALQRDIPAHIWFDSLDRYLVRGIRGYVSALTKENLIKLCTLIIYSLTVAHSENSLWDYAVSMPTTVRQDGLPQSLGQVQLLMNFQLLITTHASLLMHDFSHLALDAGAAKIMRSLQASLAALQRSMENEPDRYWRVYPKDLAASVSA